MRICKKGLCYRQDGQEGYNMWELIVIWSNGDKNVYRYRTEQDALKGQKSMHMAFGGQISWSSIRERRNWDGKNSKG